MSTFLFQREMDFPSIGSLVTDGPEKPNKHARFERMRLQNGIGSA